MQLTRRKVLVRAGNVAILAGLPGAVAPLLLPNSTTAAPIDTDRDYFAVDDPNLRARLVWATSMILRDEIVPKDMSTIIRADRIDISGEVNSLGQHVFLIAREINALPGAKLLTRPGTVARDYTGSVPAPSGTTPGADGNKGEDGGQGASGGEVRIWVQKWSGRLEIDTGGRAGGGAQSGGNGAQGAIGNAGQPPKGNGGGGGMGGQGGFAGRPGDGGNGGNVAIYYLGNSPDINVNLHKGVHGRSAAHGLPGSPGPGGPPGTGRERVCEL
jgi:hypothetical protein